jgi:hypothetical protein
MKFKTDNKDKAKRGSKNYLTKGAFGQCKNIPAGYNESKMKVIQKNKRVKNEI